MKEQYDVTKLVEYIQEQSDIDPIAYDGSYTMLHEVIRAYFPLGG